MHSKISVNRFLLESCRRSSKNNLGHQLHIDTEFWETKTEDIILRPNESYNRILNSFFFDVFPSGNSTDDSM